jgi:hypothetical protein
VICTSIFSFRQVEVLLGFLNKAETVAQKYAKLKNRHLLYKGLGAWALLKKTRQTFSASYLGHILKATKSLQP